MQVHHWDPVVSRRVRVSRSFPQLGHFIATGSRWLKTRGMRLYFLSFSVFKNSENFSCFDTEGSLVALLALPISLPERPTSTGFTIGDSSSTNCISSSLTFLSERADLSVFIFYLINTQIIMNSLLACPKLYIGRVFLGKWEKSLTLNFTTTDVLVLLKLIWCYLLFELTVRAENMAPFVALITTYPLDVNQFLIWKTHWSYWATYLANSCIFTLRCGSHILIFFASTPPQVLWVLIEHSSHGLTVRFFIECNIFLFLWLYFMWLADKFEFFRLLLRSFVCLLKHFCEVELLVLRGCFKLAICTSGLSLFLFSGRIIPLALLRVVNFIKVASKPTIQTP